MTVTTSPAAGGNSVSSGDNAEIPTDPHLVNMTIDGVVVSVPKGTLVIRAAELIGIQIPRFCDHPLLEPVGACRQCMVEIATPGPDGSLRPMPKPMTSCTTSVSEGMQVKTQYTSPMADKAQRGLMEFLLINHPLDCPVCDKGGECPLQNQAMSTGRTTSRFEDTKRTYPKPVKISPQVLLDRERCVLCARCTRFADQIAGDPFIALVERGALQQIGIFQQKPFGSYFSGNTIQICPVGALTGAAYRFRARPFDLISTPSVCEHCASGCATRTDHRRGKVLRRMAGDDPAVNEEWNCDKGRWAFTYATGTDRITEPLVRDENGNLQVAAWPEALDAAARGLLAARDAKGVGVLVGGRVSAEDAYAYSKFARIALQTNDIDFRARPHSVEEAEFLASHVVATGPSGDTHGGSVTYAEIEAATTVLLVGFEPEDESPIVFLRLRKAVRKNRTAVFAVAPLASRGLDKLGGTVIRRSSRHRDRGPAGADRRRYGARRAGHWAHRAHRRCFRWTCSPRRRDSGRRETCDSPWRAFRRCGAGVVHRCKAGMDSPARRRAWRAREWGVAQPAAGRSPGHRVQGSRRGRCGLGRHRTAREGRPGHVSHHRRGGLRPAQRSVGRRRRPGRSGRLR